MYLLFTSPKRKRLNALTTPKTKTAHRPLSWLSLKLLAEPPRKKIQAPEPVTWVHLHKSFLTTDYSFFSGHRSLALSSLFSSLKKPHNQSAGITSWRPAAFHFCTRWLIGSSPAGRWSFGEKENQEYHKLKIDSHLPYYRLLLSYFPSNLFVFTSPDGKIFLGHQTET